MGEVLYNGQWTLDVPMRGTLTTSVTVISGKASMGAMKNPISMQRAVHSPLLLTYALSSSIKYSRTIHLRFILPPDACSNRPKHGDEVCWTLAKPEGEWLPEEQTPTKQQEHITCALVQSGHADTSLLGQWYEHRVYSRDCDTSEPGIPVVRDQYPKDKWRGQITAYKFVQMQHISFRFGDQLRGSSGSLDGAGLRTMSPSLACFWRMLCSRSTRWMVPGTDVNEASCTAAIVIVKELN